MTLKYERTLCGGICSDVENMQVTGRESPVSLAHRWNVTLSLLTQCLGTVLPSIGW